MNVVSYSRQAERSLRASLALACAVAGAGLLLLLTALVMSWNGSGWLRAMPALQRTWGYIRPWHILTAAALLLLAACGACLFGYLSVRSQTARRIGRVALILGIVELLGLGAALICRNPHARRSATPLRMTCRFGLVEIGTQLGTYATVHDGRFPDRLEDATNGIRHVCPAHRPNHPAPYIYLGKGLVESFGPSASLDDAIIVIYEPLANHGDGINVLYGNTTTEWLPKSEAEDLLKQLEQWEKKYGQEAFLWPARLTTTPRTACTATLNEIAVKLYAYALGHNGQLPGRLEDLADGWVYPKGMTFTCPTDRPSHATPYIYLGKDLSKPLAPSTVLVYEPLANHGDGINVMYGDYTVQWLPKPQAEELLKRLAAESPRSRD